MGDEDENNQFYHIISASYGNIKRFGAKAIHNQMNVMPLHVEIVRRMTSQFNALKDPAKNLTLRQWLNTQGLKDQYDYGLGVLKQLLGKLEQETD